jgi:DeoR/GlpR family transcriptional regulator of sugar metabolism
VIVTGGHLRGTTYALVGSLAEENLRSLHATACGIPLEQRRAFERAGLEVIVV